MIKVELIKSLVSPLAVAATLALGAPALAQDSTAPAAEGGEAAPAAAAEAAEPAQTGPDMGVEVTDGELKPGQPYISATHGDWEVKCLNNPDGDDPCQIYQLLVDEGGNSVAEVSLGKLPTGGQAVAGATVVVPLETLLTQQLTVSVDGGQTRRYPFRFCSQPGCVANIGFTDKEIASFKKGAKATVSIVPAAAPKQKVELAMSLTGFTAAFDALETPAAPQ